MSGTDDQDDGGSGERCPYSRTNGLVADERAEMERRPGLHRRSWRRIR